jgi:hypothetical protein
MCIRIFVVSNLTTTVDLHRDIRTYEILFNHTVDSVLET